MSNLFSSITLGGLTLENRLVVPPMCQYVAGADGVPVPWHRMHYGSMAISGAGLVIFEATAVQAFGRISPNDLGLYTDGQESALAALLRELRTFSSAKFGIQLAHAGRKASSEPFDNPYPVAPANGGWIPFGPAAVAHSDRWPVPIALTEADINAVVESFVRAAQRADRAGFDMIELHGAHGYLISSFLSSIANHRTDKYGGTLENRMRLAVDVARAVRDVWPAHKALGFRLNGTDWFDGGITVEETAALASVLKDCGVEMLSVSSGGNARGQKLPPLLPGYQVPLASAIKKSAGICTMAAGLILTGAQAERIVSIGDADLIGIGRGMLDDPRWPLRAAQELGAEVSSPRSYWRSRAGQWPGYDRVHGSCEVEV